MKKLTAILLLLPVLISCHKQLGPTTIRVEDSLRHYPAVVLGQELPMVFLLHNTGSEVLVLTDIQPSCPTVECATLNVRTIPPGGEVPLTFIFHSEKNVGPVQHSIRLFGNIAPNGVAELTFSTHVVRPSSDLSDYEEYYHKNLISTEQQLQEAPGSPQRYWTDKQQP